MQLESGLNDAVLLPIVVVAMAFAAQGQMSVGSLAKLSLGLFILGPGAGIAIGLLAVAALDLIRKRTGIRRDYESLYSLGVAFSAFAAAEAVHGSGFLAAFTAGLTIASLDVELCDCFVEYGGVTAEMFLLFTFVIFGGSLIWSGFYQLDLATVIFALVAMLVRVPIYLLSLLGSPVDRRGRLLIAWFGPRGLSSLLLVLLPVFAGLPGSDRLFAICSLVVLLSVVIHGGSPMLLAKIARKRELELSRVPETDPQPEPEKPARRSLPVIEIDSTSQSNSQSNIVEVGSQSITFEELKKLQDAGEPVIILDVRTDRSLETSDHKAKNAVRINPDHAVLEARETKLPKDAWLIAYCA